MLYGSALTLERVKDFFQSDFLAAALYPGAAHYKVLPFLMAEATGGQIGSSRPQLDHVQEPHSSLFLPGCIFV